ncbi:hypothetical protein [Sphingobacterium sp. LRF_L2]|uniref:hypothetical protein n=1 Tax=Sphingobacterium sp. LRF_L2 TaxID=3369421 RepID=UPI003F5EB57E
MNIKFYTIILVTSLIFISCQQHSETQHQKTTADSNLVTSATEHISSTETENNNTLPVYGNLYPIEIVNPDSEDVFKRYGIEFSGVCYACDLAKIVVNEHTIKLVNVCDDLDLNEMALSTYSNKGNKILFTTKSQKFILTKITDTPVYKLEITGEELNFENKRLVTYYTDERIITQFEQHDCGDFQG